MTKYCEDCGTRMSENNCPNCHEELYIFENQILADGVDITLSDEFAAQVREQMAIREASND